MADGIISGQDNGAGQAKTLAPQTQASRGVTATIISRILKPFEGEYVISASEAKEKISSPNVIFIDGRGMAQDAETIKGAVVSSWQDWSVKMNGTSPTGAPGWWKIMDAAQLNTTLGNLGLSKDKEIILLGETKTGWGDDARLMWELRAAGYENVKIVDGGYRMLTAVGAPTQKGTSKLTKTDAKVTSIEETHLMNTYRLKADYAKYKVIDTRTDAEYEGQKLYNEKNGGHLPGAVHLRYTDLFFDDGTLRPVKELTKWFESAGLTKDDKVVTYCTAGIRSSYMQVIMEMCGFEHTFNYDESFWGWTETDGVVE